MAELVTEKDIALAIEKLGLSGKPVCIHSSLRSFGWVEGGAKAIIQGFLNQGCTILVPTFSWRYAVPPPADDRPARNGWDYKVYPGRTSGVDLIFTPASNVLDREDMGAIPEAVLSMPSRVRGNHPLCSFTALGPLAERIVADQRPLDVYAPFAALADEKGFVVLMGVGFDRMTLLHFAEKLAGRNLFRRWANDLQGSPMATEVGGCSDGFTKFEAVLSPFTQRLEVGGSLWRVLPARQALDTATQAIREDPGITHCGDAQCQRCNDGVQGGPIL